MSGMKMRTLHGLHYEIRNTLRSRNFWCYIIVCTLMCISGYVQGGTFDGAFGFLAGIERFSLEDISMNNVIQWLMPHLLLSVYIGECGERDMRMQRLIMPRYATLKSYWRFQAVKLLIISLIYYALIILISSLASYALGNRLIKVSEVVLSRHNLYSGNMPASWLVMLDILLRAGFAMAMVGIVQLALAWFSGSQRFGVAAFALLMLVPLFIVDTNVQRVLPCDMSMYMRGGSVTDGLSLIWVCVICTVGIFATTEILCLAARRRTIIVN